MPMPSENRLLAHARSFENLTRTDEAELAARIAKGDARAKDRLVEANMRLGFKLARGYEGCGLPQEDLVQEAMVGLSIAAGKFNPSKGRFTTYATRWVKKMLWDAAYGTGDVIKTPSRLSRTVTAVRDHLQKNPSADLEELVAVTKRPETEVVEALDHSRVVASTSEESFREVGDEVLEEAESALECLEPAEREAISWKHGLYGTPRSLFEVAEQLTSDPDLPGEYDSRDAARLCRVATRKLRARREPVDDVICRED